MYIFIHITTENNFHICTLNRINKHLQQRPANPSWKVANPPDRIEHNVLHCAGPLTYADISKPEQIVSVIFPFCAARSSTWPALN